MCVYARFRFRRSLSGHSLFSEKCVSIPSPAGLGKRTYSPSEHQRENTELTTSKNRKKKKTEERKHRNSVLKEFLFSFASWHRFSLKTERPAVAISKIKWKIAFKVKCIVHSTFLSFIRQFIKRCIQILRILRYISIERQTFLAVFKLRKSVPEVFNVRRIFVVRGELP